MKCENHFLAHAGIPGIRSAGETLEYCSQTRTFVQFFFFRTPDRTLRSPRAVAAASDAIAKATLLVNVLERKLQ